MQVTPAMIRAGLDLHQTYSVSFYDAIVLASAQTTRCSVLLNEDMNAEELWVGFRCSTDFKVAHTGCSLTTGMKVCRANQKPLNIPHLRGESAVVVSGVFICHDTS